MYIETLIHYKLRETLFSYVLRLNSKSCTKYASFNLGIVISTNIVNYFTKNVISRRLSSLALTVAVCT